MDLSSPQPSVNCGDHAFALQDLSDQSDDQRGPRQFPVNLTEFYAIEALVVWHLRSQSLLRFWHFFAVLDTSSKGQGAFSTVWRARHRTSGQARQS